MFKFKVPMTKSVNPQNMLLIECLPKKANKNTENKQKKIINFHSFHFGFLYIKSHLSFILILLSPSSFLSFTVWVWKLTLVFICYHDESEIVFVVAVGRLFIFTNNRFVINFQWFFFFGWKLFINNSYNRYFLFYCNNIEIYNEI